MFIPFSHIIKYTTGAGFWFTGVLAFSTSESQAKLEIAQSEQDVSPFCKESDMTYSWKRQIGLFLRQ